jgi:TolB-like protein
MKCPNCRFENPEGTRFCGGCAAPLPFSRNIPSSATKTLETPLLELTRGATFADRYEIIEELGKGGMARVYRAYDRKIEEDIALKLIKSDISADAQTIERFRNELKLARKITHRNVCRMYDLNEEDGTHYITMEYIPGEDLKTLIKRMGKIPSEKSISIAKQVCKGLIEAHRIGIIHRDLKPQNIMIDRLGNARIMDFGIAHSVQVKGVTADGMAIGTPDYMSPEQVKGQEADQRSDIYSLGVTFYEMLTGKVPFEDATPYAIAMKHLTDTPKAPKEVDPLIREGLNDIILKCMEKKKEKRFQNIQELYAELERLETNFLAKEEKDLATEKDLSFRKVEDMPRRKRLPPVWMIGILILGAIIIAGGYLLLNKSSQPETPVSESQTAEWQNSIAVLPFRDLSPEQNQEHFIFGMADAINDRLTQLNVLKVTSTTSVMRYKNTEKDVQQIGEELGVAHILEGSIQTEGEKIRVVAQLINAETRFHLWSDTFEQDRKSVFDVQDRVSEAIAEALKVELLPDAFADLEKDRPKNFEAYEYYLKGINYISSRWLVTEDEKDFETAVDMFEKALDIDPQYSLAYSGLAYGYMLLGAGFGLPDAWKEMGKYNDKAYELDPESAMANIMRAATFHVNGKYKQALSYCKRALDLNPNLAEVNFTAGVICRQLGLFHRAIKYAEKSIALDPYNPLSFGVAGRSYSHLDDPEKALPFWEKAYQLMPAFVFMFLAREHMIMENFDKAEEIIKEAEESGIEIIRIQRTQAFLFSFRGEKEKALEISKNAEIYALLGMKNEALEIIEKAIDRPLSFNYLYLKNYSLFDSLQDEPRFQKILEIQKQKYEERLIWAAGL